MTYSPSAAAAVSQPVDEKSMKRWSGPLDDVMVNMVGAKLVPIQDDEDDVEDLPDPKSSCIVN